MTPTNHSKHLETTKQSAEFLSKYVSKYSKRDNSRLKNNYISISVIPTAQRAVRAAQPEHIRAQPRAAKDGASSTEG